jgi:hypothetical protein
MTWREEYVKEMQENHKSETQDQASEEERNSSEQNIVQSNIQEDAGLQKERR